MLLLGEYTFLDYVIHWHIGLLICSKQLKFLLEGLELILIFHFLDQSLRNICRNWMLISLKQGRITDGNKELHILLILAVMKLNLETLLPLQDSMELINLSSMGLDLMQVIVLSCLKLMELCRWFKVKMGGTGPNMESREMTGKHGRNGLSTQISMSPFFHSLKNQELDSMSLLLQSSSNRNKVFLMVITISCLVGSIHLRITIQFYWILTLFWQLSVGWNVYMNFQSTNSSLKLWTKG